MFFCWILLGILTLEKLWKLSQIHLFFSTAVESQPSDDLEIDLVHPIVSGDPYLSKCLQSNLENLASNAIQVKTYLVVGETDHEALELCGRLSEQFEFTVVRVKPAPQGVSPKTHKLKAGLKAGRSEVVAFLDDDTTLPKEGLAQAAMLLDEDVGLVHGLPYYRSFDNIWSALVACFVNAHSLLTYIPYLRLSAPVTINGMFYAIRRKTLKRLGGLESIEYQLCDDFAIGQAVQKLG